MSPASRVESRPSQNNRANDFAGRCYSAPVIWKSLPGDVRLRTGRLKPYLNTRTQADTRTHTAWEPNDSRPIPLRQNIIQSRCRRCVAEIKSKIMIVEKVKRTTPCFDDSKFTD